MLWNNTVEIHIGDCFEYLKTIPDNSIDSLITDPPYEISLYSKNWDNTGIAFSKELWLECYRILKPGAFIASFAASRKYHRLAVAIEDAGFTLYPFLYWTFTTGLQKPTNLSELFDRENPDRKTIGKKNSSGYTKGNVIHEGRNRSSLDFPLKERYTTPESKEWAGYYYGLNCLKPMGEPIALAQKPISEKSVVANIRKYRTGALNLWTLAERQEKTWAETILPHKKENKTKHGFDHPSVKPVELMIDLCHLCCPKGGKIIDIFGGTGTTAEAAFKSGFDSIIIEKNEDMKPAIAKRAETANIIYR